jgi:hypothetical protein
MKFREKELSIKEAEDEEKRQAAEAEAAKAAAAEAAAREAAEAQAQAMVEGDGAPEQAPAEEEAAAGSKLSKEQEAAEGILRSMPNPRMSRMSTHVFSCRLCDTMIDLQVFWFARTLAE